MKTMINISTDNYSQTIKEVSTMKTTYQWKEEAESFVYEYEQATGHKPSFNEVVAECEDIGIDNYKEYAEMLFSYMEEV